MGEAQACFVTPLIEITPQGILAPDRKWADAALGAGGQFFDGAELYVERYAAQEHFLNYIRMALEDVDLGGDVRRILDIGSGAGNTVFPCLTLFPGASVVATDLSPQLLAILMRQAEGRPDWMDRLTCVCIDACADYYREGAFDLLVGGAILHHLIDPEAALATLRRALRRGGVAVFFEPFENGHAILRLAYEAILEKAERHGLMPAVKTLLAALVGDITARTGSDKSAPHFPHLDDKWLFTRDYLVKAARTAGFASLEIKPRHIPARLFSVQTEIYLRLGAGLAPTEMGAWAWDVLRHYDELFSAEMRKELYFEAGIVLHR